MKTRRSTKRASCAQSEDRPPKARRLPPRADSASAAAPSDSKSKAGQVAKSSSKASGATKASKSNNKGKNKSQTKPKANKKSKKMTPEEKAQNEAMVLAIIMPVAMLISVVSTELVKLHIRGRNPSFDTVTIIAIFLKKVMTKFCTDVEFSLEQACRVINKMDVVRIILSGKEPLNHSTLRKRVDGILLQNVGEKLHWSKMQPLEMAGVYSLAERYGLSLPAEAVVDTYHPDYVAIHGLPANPAQNNAVSGAAAAAAAATEEKKEGIVVAEKVNDVQCAGTQDTTACVTPSTKLITTTNTPDNGENAKIVHMDINTPCEEKEGIFNLTPPRIKDAVVCDF